MAYMTSYDLVACSCENDFIIIIMIVSEWKLIIINLTIW